MTPIVIHSNKTVMVSTLTALLEDILSLLTLYHSAKVIQLCLHNYAICSVQSELH